MARSVWWTAGAVALAVSAGALYESRGRFVGRATQATPASTLPVSRRLQASVTTTGTVRLKSGASVRVGAQASGIVYRLNVTVGSQVHLGDVIAEIDPRPIDSRIAEARAQVAIDQLTVAKAERDLSRSQRLLAAGIIAPQDTEELDWQLKLAHARLASSQSTLAAAEIDRSYATIRAPIGGIVASVSTQEGETVASSFAAPTFVTIVDAGALELVAMVDETDIAGVAVGQSVTFTVEANPLAELKATVTRIDPTPTIVSGVVNYPVTAAMVSRVRFLRPEMTANIAIHTSTFDALVVPASAVRGDGASRYVYVLRGDAAIKQNVTPGVRDGAFIEIKRGLTPRDRVVIDPLDAAKEPTP
jgi:macrolide-specific efflux system membrane fusion protein